MTCLRLAAAALTLLALPALAQPALQASPNNRIGFVNTERVLRDSAPAIRAQTKLKAEFQKREDEIARLEEQLKRQQVELEKNAVAMNESQRRVRERDLGELNRDRNWRRSSTTPTASSARSPSRRSTTSSSRMPSTPARASTSPTG